MPDQTSRLTPDQVRAIRARYSRRETEDTRYSPTAIDVLSAIADDVPALLAEIEALRADVARLRETLLAIAARGPDLDIGDTGEVYALLAGVLGEAAWQRQEDGWRERYPHLYR